MATTISSWFSINRPLFHVEDLGGTLAPPVAVAALTGFGVAVAKLPGQFPLFYLS